MYFQVGSQGARDEVGHMRLLYFCMYEYHLKMTVNPIVKALDPSYKFIPNVAIILRILLSVKLDPSVNIHTEFGRHTISIYMPTYGPKPIHHVLLFPFMKGLLGVQFAFCFVILLM